VEVSERDDGFSIRGTSRSLKGTVNAFGDHRIAMAFSILGASPDVDLSIRGTPCVKTSFPTFFEHLEALTAGRGEINA
jgi:3-phosphoshikimate 1-carboxyvinyltransferase